MNLKNKKVMLIGICALAIVIAGILLALLLTPVTRFLFGGTGDDFRNAGSCKARTVAPSPTPNDSIVIVDNTPVPQDNETHTSEAPLPTATPAPYEALYELADTSMMKDIVNILLIGVDFSEERLTWNGKKEWHSDVMMVLSVNFEENRADLISLPRDTYAKIPGVDGIYKLNASINCGGGLYRTDGTVNPAGLEKVCEAAEWMLGGIPVDYYYAVTMTSLKSLVDAFGGLDYDLDIAFKIQGRSYVKGMQHMDGQAVLDYCRVRKAGNGLASSETGDANRVNRQKRILVAFFEQMKKNNLIVKIPDILAAFDGELFTNCTAAQTAALAAFAYNLDRDRIGLHSMSGASSSLFQWNFTFTDQANRVDIIKKVYGVDVKQKSEYTLKYGRYRWASMLYDVYVDLCDPLADYVQELIDEDDLLPEFTATPAPTDVPKPDDTSVPTETPVPTPEPITIRVALEWEDDNDADGLRPTAVPVRLLANGADAGRDNLVLKRDKYGRWEGAFGKVPKTEGVEYTVEVDGREKVIKELEDYYRFEVKGSSEFGFTIVCKRIESEGEGDTNPAPGKNALHFEQTRRYTAEQRRLFEDFKAALESLKQCKKEADKEAQKSKSGKSNQLNAISVTYMSELAMVQTLAIRVAETFGYSDVKNFTVPFPPTGSGWNTTSPWAVNYGLDRKFNEVRVDFN